MLAVSVISERRPAGKLLEGLLELPHLIEEPTSILRDEEIC